MRCVAQRLGRTISEVRVQEDERADLLVSELYRWQQALEVPIEELLADPVDSLSPRVTMRAQLLKVMKTAMAIRRQARSEAERRLASIAGRAAAGDHARAERGFRLAGRWASTPRRRSRAHRREPDPR